MSFQVKIELTPEAESRIAGLQSLPVRVVQAVSSAMKNENDLTLSHIQREHLNGVGPFPPEQHRLGRRTGRLVHSINASAPVINGNNVDSAIGSNVIYAAIHEFGGRIKKPAHQQKVRLKTDARGNLVRQLGHSNLATFAGADEKRARESTVNVGAHDIEMPERAPIRTGIGERKPSYARSISAAIVSAFGKSK
jgi:phage gpG-like protein